MIGKLAALIFLSSASLIQTAEVLHQISLTEIEVGDSVTLICPVSEKDGKFFHWYKQPLGYMVQEVATGILGKITINEQFKESRFKISKGEDQYFFTIRNVTKGDEATYFCQNGTAYTQKFVSGTFLVVNDRNEQKHVYMKQSPKTESVQPGDSVTLQCSLLSNNKEKRVQCPGEHSVYWFRAGSEGFNPGVIYTHSNRSNEQGDRSCVYSLSKTIQDSSDAGTYYCAVATCGEILFGEGTKIETGQELDLVVLVLGALLACCVTVIAAFVVYVCRRTVCEHCKEEVSASDHHGHDRLTVDQPNDVGDAAEAMNYVALNFSTKNTKRMKTNRETAEECVYSAVDYNIVDHHIQHQPTF